MSFWLLFYVLPFFLMGIRLDEGWEPFSGSKLVRLVQPSDRVQVLPEGSYPAFPAKAIVGWTALDDYPNGAEHDELGLVFNYDFSARTLQIQFPLVRGHVCMGLCMKYELMRSPNTNAIDPLQKLALPLASILERP